jgi:DNA-binding NarL/FixJ family response regulator
LAALDAAPQQRAERRLAALYEVAEDLAGGRIDSGLDAQAGVEPASLALEESELIAQELDQVLADVAAVAARAPDVVLLDVQLPGLDGIEVAERLATREAPPDVVLMSISDERSYGERLARAPVRGFLKKERLTRRTITAILE